MSFEETKKDGKLEQVFNPVHVGYATSSNTENIVVPQHMNSGQSPGYSLCFVHCELTAIHFMPPLSLSRT
jgi:hypothetical protein